MHALGITTNAAPVELELPEDNAEQAIISAIGNGCAEVERHTISAYGELGEGSPGLDMWADKNGMEGQELNELATALASDGNDNDPVLNGTVVLTSRDGEGNTVALTPEWDDAIATTVVKHYFDAKLVEAAISMALGERRRTTIIGLN